VLEPEHVWHRYDEYLFTGHRESLHKGCGDSRSSGCHPVSQASAPGADRPSNAPYLTASLPPGHVFQRQGTKSTRNATESHKIASDISNMGTKSELGTYTLSFKGLGSVRFFMFLKEDSSGSPRLHLFDQKYCKNWEIVKYYYNLK